SAQSRRQADEQHCRQIMLNIEVPRIMDFTKNRDQRFHRGLPESGKPSSESTFTSNAIRLYLSAIPLPLTPPRHRFAWGEGNPETCACPQATGLVGLQVCI